MGDPPHSRLNSRVWLLGRIVCEFLLKQTLTNIFPLDYWHQGDYNLKELAIQWQHSSGRLRQKNICENDIHLRICRTGWMQDRRMKARSDTGQIRYRSGRMQDRTMEDRVDAGQDG